MRHWMCRFRSILARFHSAEDRPTMGCCEGKLPSPDDFLAAHHPRPVGPFLACTLAVQVTPRIAWVRLFQTMGPCYQDWQLCSMFMLFTVVGHLFLHNSSYKKVHCCASVASFSSCSKIFSHQAPTTCNPPSTTYHHHH